MLNDAQKRIVVDKLRQGYLPQEIIAQLRPHRFKGEDVLDFMVAYVGIKKLRLRGLEPKYLAKLIDLFDSKSKEYKSLYGRARNANPDFVSEFNNIKEILLYIHNQSQDFYDEYEEYEEYSPSKNEILDVMRDLPDGLRSNELTGATYMLWLVFNEIRASDILYVNELSLLTDYTTYEESSRLQSIIEDFAHADISDEDAILWARAGASGYVAEVLELISAGIKPEMFPKFHSSLSSWFTGRHDLFAQYVRSEISAEELKRILEEEIAED